LLFLFVNPFVLWHDMQLHSGCVVWSVVDATFFCFASQSASVSSSVLKRCLGDLLRPCARCIFLTNSHWRIQTCSAMLAEKYSHSKQYNLRNGDMTSRTTIYSETQEVYQIKYNVCGCLLVGRFEWRRRSDFPCALYPQIQTMPLVL
jgi:hypothetical protein